MLHTKYQGYWPFLVPENKIFKGLIPYMVMAAILVMFCFIYLSYVGTGFAGLNQYLARINISCSRTQHSEAGEARTVSSQVLYH